LEGGTILIFKLETRLWGQNLRENMSNDLELLLLKRVTSRRVFASVANLFESRRRVALQEVVELADEGLVLTELHFYRLKHQ